MALKPTDLELSDQELSIVKGYEEAIDAALRDQYGADRTLYHIDLYRVLKGEKIIPPRILSELQRLYKEAGWKSLDDRGNGTIVLTRTSK